MRTLLTIAAVLAVTLSTTAIAQEPAELPPVAHNHVVSSNVLGVVAKWFNVELERKTGSVGSVGVSGSALAQGEGDGSVRRANVFLRFYPQGAALSGIFVTLRAGYLWNSPYPEHDNAVTAGVEIGKTRLLGRNRNIAISTGFGLDRAWYSQNDSLVIPNIRLFNLGIAF